MTYKVVISNSKHTFPLKGLNELLGGRMYNFRTKKYHNSVKSENDKVCRLAIQKYMRGVKIDKTIRCTYMIYAGDKRHDRGNLACAVEKSFLDALQETKVIKNDGFDDVLDSVFHTELCRDNPRIEVIIEEVEGEWVMRLISQDGMIDVPYEQAIIEYEACERNGEDVFHIIFARTTRNTFPIARYSTEAKALKVMEMLREKYAKLEIFKSVYQKGLLTELNKELGFDEMQNTLTSIFKFPDDSEVEV